MSVGGDLESAQIPKIRPPETVIGRFVAVPLTAKFFLLGALASFVGGAWLGVHLWLMVNGQMKLPPTYPQLRELHALIQIFLFFGLFILGFLIQTGGKMLKVQKSAPAWGALIPPVLICGVWWRSDAPDSTASAALLALPFLVVFVHFVGLARRTTEKLRREFAVWVLISLASFTLFAFLRPAEPLSSVVFFWGAIVPVTFAAGQQFIFAFLKGRKSPPEPLLVLFGLSAACLTGTLFLGRTEFPICAGALTLVTLGYYILRTGLYGAWREIFRNPIVTGFLSAYFWALAGAISILARARSDITLHIWAIGWICPLIFAISSQMIRSIVGSFLIPPRGMVALILLWQIVVFGRCGAALFGLPPELANLVAFFASLVFILWTIGLIGGVCSALKRTAPLPRSRP